MCCRWSQKILKITQSIGSSFFHCFVQLLHIVFLHWFVCQVRFMLKFSWCIHLFTLFLIPDMISFSFMRFPVYIILLLIFFVSCYYVDSFKWANLFSFLSLSLSLSVLSSNWSLSWIPLYGHFGTQKGILLKLGWIFYWRCWRTFRCCLLILMETC